MSFKQEAIDAIKVYRRKMAYWCVQGDDDERVQAIDTCIRLVEEIKDTSEEELKAKLEEAYARGYAEAEVQMHDKLKELSIKMARGTGRNGMAMQMMVVDDITEGEGKENG